MMGNDKDCKHEPEVIVEYDDWGILCKKCGCNIDDYVILTKAQNEAKDEQLTQANQRIADLEERVKQLETSLSHSFVNEFAQSNGGFRVYASWRDNMLNQGRGVSAERMLWETLDSKDRILDALIAYDVIMDFVAYIFPWPHEALQPKDES